MRTAVRALVTSLLLLAATGFVAAQDDPMAGVSVEALGSTMPAQTDGHALNLLRITMQPGAHVAPHSHPGTVVVVVESGRFGTEFDMGEGVVTRAAGEVAPIRIGEPHVLEPGDALAYDGSAAHTMSNAGDAPLVLLVAALLDPDEEGFMFHD